MFKRIRQAFRKEPTASEAKESRTSDAILIGNKQAEWSKREYAAFADEGYRKNVVAYQAIDKTARAVSSIPWTAFRKNGEELAAHPLLELINKPNPNQSGKELIEAMVGFYKISGNSYLERVMVGSAPRELWALRSDRVTIKPGNSVPAAFKYQVGQEKVTWEVDQVTGESDILHIKTFNPLDDWYGLSPIEAGAYGIDIHNESQQHIMALMQNGATPSGGLEIDTLNDEQYNRIKAEVEEKYTGSKNAGRPLLLEGGMKWIQMGMTPQSMQIIETKYASARDVSLALAVPPLLLNIPGDSTYSNYKEARLAFYEESVIPLAERIRDELNNWLSPLFDDVRLELDLDAVPAIAEKRRELFDMAEKATFLKLNEKRELVGYESIEGGDTVYINSGLIPLSFDAPFDDRDPDESGAEAYGNGNRE